RRPPQRADRLTFIWFFEMNGNSRVVATRGNLCARRFPRAVHDSAAPAIRARAAAATSSFARSAAALDPPHHHANDDADQDHTHHAARAIAPVPAVGPRWHAAKEQQDEQDEQKESKAHRRSPQEKPRIKARWEQMTKSDVGQS